MTAIPEIPHGAIENGRAFLQRLADHYDFTCEAGSLANCTDYHEAVRCFEFIAQWAYELTASLPFLRGVKVKEMEWVDRGETVTHQYKVDTICGVYYIERNKAGLFDWWSSTTRGKHEAKTIEAAKSAAQADYEARILSAIEFAPSPRAQALEEAAKLCEKYAQSYQSGLCHYGSIDKDAGRGRQEGHINAGNELAAAIRALSSQPVADGWLPIDGKNRQKSDRILAVATGSIERISWNDPAAVVTVKAFDGPFVCHVHENGEGFTDEFGEVYRADGIVIDAEDLTAADNVLRLTHWHPLPASPGASE